jgi:hypothetical protein
MNRIKNLHGVAKYVVWMCIGMALGAVYPLVTGPFFESGPMHVWLGTGALAGFLKAVHSDLRARKVPD